MSNQPEVPEKYREIKPGAVVEHYNRAGDLIATGTVTKPPYPYGAPTNTLFDGWLYEMDKDNSKSIDSLLYSEYWCEGARVIQPAPEAPPSAESRLAEIAGLVRDKAKILEKVAEAYKTLPFGPFGHWASEVHPTDCLLLGGHGEDASAIAHQIDRDDAMALADILNAAEEMKELLERIEQLTKGEGK